MVFERPSLRVGCCKWMVEHLDYVKNLDVMDIGKFYGYGYFELSPIQLYHDVLNCGWRIWMNILGCPAPHKTIHITDTSHVNGIEAKRYDLYAIEHNYNEEGIEEAIAKKTAVGEFSYENRAVNTHLSEQQAKEFIYKNRKESSQVVRLHESSSQL